MRAIAAISDPAKQKAQLNAFMVDRFDTSMAGKRQELVDALRRFTLYSMQQYRTRYLLARLTQHVEMAFSGVKTPGSLEPLTKLEIEHILPDNPTPELLSSWTAENPGASYDDYKNRFGNLTLLEKPINIVASNDFYLAKQHEYRKSGNYLTRSLFELTDVGKNTSITRINEHPEIIFKLGFKGHRVPSGNTDGLGTGRLEDIADGDLKRKGCMAMQRIAVPKKSFPCLLIRRASMPWSLKIQAAD